MNAVIKVESQDLNVVEYQGKRVVTLAMIDSVHQRPEGTAKRNFTENRHRFIDGEDFYLIDYSKKNEFHQFGIEIPARGMVMLTESHLIRQPENILKLFAYTSIFEFGVDE